MNIVILQFQSDSAVDDDMDDDKNNKVQVYKKYEVRSMFIEKIFLERVGFFNITVSACCISVYSFCIVIFLLLRDSKGI